MTIDDPRVVIQRLASDRGESLAALSTMLRRNAAYLQQFVRRASPRRLAEADRRLLADHFGIDEAELGAPAPRAEATANVPFLDIGVSAGPGAVAESERLVRHIPLALSLLRSLGVTATDATLVIACGMSMAPNILDGDRLLVDRSARRVGAQGSIFVARIDDALVVKRLSCAGATMTVASDNPDYAPFIRGSDEVTVIGRVKLLLREPR